MHIQHTGSGLVWLKEGFLQDSVFSGLWFFTVLPELLTGETSNTRATTHLWSTGNSGHNRKILFTKELNGLIYQIGKHTKRAWLMSWRWQQHKSLLFMAQSFTDMDAGPSRPFTKALQITVHGFVTWEMPNWVFFHVLILPTPHLFLLLKINLYLLQST